MSKTWWKNATIYQIWPASYKDSNGDGLGDINGIIETLDYLKDLGVDIVWLSPHYDSPQDDMGYDISDYNKIYPPYGSMEDMDRLTAEIHKRGMRVILDLVINHTSSEHAWFKESRSSLDNPKRDWYIWRKPRFDAEGNRLPPNNWASCFSGSAWEWDEHTGEYYLRLFASTQPDLNWENEETRNEIYKVALKFWFDKGIDGFRIDTAGLYSKVEGLPDAPIVFPDRKYQPPGDLTNNGPRIHEFHQEMYQKVTGNYDIMTVGEVGNSLREGTLKYVSASRKEMNMIFLFGVVETGVNPADRFLYEGFTLKEFKKQVKEQGAFVEGTDAWLTAFLENHDQPRLVTRFGLTKPEYLFKSAKLLALLQTALTGTLFLYQGQEIAMTNLPRSWDVSEYKDIQTINYWKELEDSGASEEKKKKVMDAINLVARDHARSPVQWNDSPHAGFTTGTPWTRVNDNYQQINIAKQVGDPNSVHSFWKNALKVRKQYDDLFIYGSAEILDEANEKTFTIVKLSPATKSKAYVVLNFSEDEVKFEKLVEGDYKLVNTNVKDPGEFLGPYEGRVYIVD